VANAGRTVLRVGGKRGLLAGGKSALFNADGDCPVCCFDGLEMDGYCPFCEDGGWGETEIAWPEPPATQATFDAAWGRLTDAGGVDWDGFGQDKECIGYNWGYKLSLGNTHWYLNAYGYAATIDTSMFSEITEAKLRIRLTPSGSNNWTSNMSVDVYSRKGAFTGSSIVANRALGTLEDTITVLPSIVTARTLTLPNASINVSGAGAVTSILIVPSWGLKPTFPGGDGTIYQLSHSARCWMKLTGVGW